MSRRALSSLTAAIAACLGLSGDLLRAQPALAGPEILISPPSVYVRDAAMATLSGGGFVVAWQDGQEALVRPFDAEGLPASPAVTAGRTDRGIDLAAVGSGFVVAGLTDPVQAPLRLARIFDAAGHPQEEPFVIETPASSPNHASPHVAAADRNGSFVIAWIGLDAATGSEEVFLRRFSAAGVPRGEPWRVVRASGGTPVCCVDVAQDPDGKTLVAWQESGQIFGQFFSPAGEALGLPFQMGSGTAFQVPAVAFTAGGAFLAAWSSGSAPQHPAGIYGQLYDSAGRPRGKVFPIALGEAVSAPVLATTHTAAPR